MVTRLARIVLIATACACTTVSDDVLFQFEFFSAGDPPQRSSVVLLRDRILVEEVPIRFSTPIDERTATEVQEAFGELVACPFVSDLSRGDGVVDIPKADGSPCSMSMADSREHLGSTLAALCRHPELRQFRKGFSLCGGEPHHTDP